MKRLLSTLLLASFCLCVRAQNDNVAWRLKIREVDVVTRRPMKEIGVQKTQLDSMALHENVALSMADVLTFNSSIFVKQYGRATLSTVAFRGTSPSHTQVTWNGMRINSPMLGMTDFSMIPSYFIDDASLLHGTSSVNVTGGGLGGAVQLATKPAETRGLGLQYIQGIGSFKTFDEFLRLTYGNDRWQSSTRAVYSSSPNRYKYRNYNKKINVYDDEHRIVSTYYPVERNKCGDFHDLHLLQEVYCNTGRGDRFGLTAWYLDSRRGVPMLNVDHKDDAEFVNEQQERTLRSVVSWDRIRNDFKLGVKAGYIHTFQGYDYSRDLGNGTSVQMIRSRSYVNTLYASADAEYSIGRKWLFTATLSAHQHFVESQDKNIITQQGDKAIVGYDQARVELSGYVSAKWRPVERLGLSLALREELYGSDWTPVIPAFFADYVLSERGNVVAKASVSRNYRYPTLNDLYFLPGGNPDLRREHGITYDGGIGVTVGREERYTLHAEATWFDSYIDDWIIWLPTFKGFWTPMNIKEVHAYGIELKGQLGLRFARDWRIDIDGNFSWTPSINHGDPINWADESIGKQLVYVPEYSAAVNGRLTFRNWGFTYKWCYYSERFTTSSNETATKLGRVMPYFMSDVALDKRFALRWADLSVKGAVKNLFNEEYESVLSRPMPRLNYEIFLEIRPRWGKSRLK